MNQQFIEGVADTFNQDIYQYNLKIVPTSATITIYKPGSTEKVVDGVAMAVAVDGRLSYDLTTTHTETADLNYKVEISYSYNAITYPIVAFFDVVKVRLSKVITDQDIVDELPQLKDNGWRVHGDAESGSATTIVDTNLKRYPDDYFAGGIAYSFDKDEERKIEDFVASTGTVTVVAFTGPIVTDKYVLTQPYTREINSAWDELWDDLVSNGLKPHLILDSQDLRAVHISYTVRNICRGLSRDGEGTFWWEMWKSYEKTARYAFKSLHVKYDESEDGYISETEERKTVKRTLGRG